MQSDYIFHGFDKSVLVGDSLFSEPHRGEWAISSNSVEWSIPLPAHQYPQDLKFNVIDFFYQDSFKPNNRLLRAYTENQTE